MLQFGSLALGSWVLTVIQYVRAALENIRQQAAENGGGFLVACIAGCLDLLYSLFQQLTKFGIGAQTDVPDAPRHDSLLQRLQHCANEQQQ